jgi:hypothetical protein
MATIGATKLYGLMAEFETPTDIVEAARRVYDEGYRQMDAYSPYPIEELSEAIGFSLCYWASAIAYPLNIGGRPLNSWPAFIPVTFECTILLAAFGAVFGMLALNRLPQPYHPVFNVPRFELATRNTFFLCVEARDPKFDKEATRAFLLSLGPREVTDVEY